MSDKGTEPDIGAASNMNPASEIGTVSGTGAGLDEAEARDLAEAWLDEPLAPAARRLLIGAVEAFAARGYHATATRDIAARAGLSPAGVYVHFSSKEELLYQISLIGHRGTVRVVRAAAAAAKHDDPADKLRAVIAAITAWHARYHTTARVINYELSTLTERHRATIATLRREIDAMVRQTLEEGVALGVFDAPDVRGTTLALLSLTIDVARWFRATGARAPEELGAFYGQLALRMVGHRA
ncbi:MAG TPA: TetR/AcrR family transcriptional regulator [Actinocrinis sp.]|uniref:TetR/AcrR family transcriptional regulator n=1 Tax=Actinocrinis sp. TaxID=1920516 RepID=UPI002DDCB2FA|nr:TetR/AcrR family transcriptional regulator [Actinocrinis sp.]HEV2347571.1 TetR/AcrR family transcriptional regulator [Actinocrinis sp.]